MTGTIHTAVVSQTAVAHAAVKHKQVSIQFDASLFPLLSFHQILTQARTHAHLLTCVTLVDGRGSESH